jgi:2-dehydro-3-deoxyphosphogluconate aldolase/(4S)-4-hydroxy-2-oxoglutarate aldolase
MNKIFECKVVPAAVIDAAERAVPLAETLLKAGMNVLEITFRTPAAESAVQLIARRFPEMFLGAGTLLSEEQVERAFHAGARFGVAPGVNPTVVRKAAQLGLPLVPGVMTPTEIEQAIGLGCTLLKFFPAEVAGGVNMLKALWGPYAHTGIRFIPTGGISTGNMAQYLALPAVAAVGGSWMVEKKLIAAGDWNRIEALTRESLQRATTAQNTPASP